MPHKAKHCVQAFGLQLPTSPLPCFTRLTRFCLNVKCSLSNNEKKKTVRAAKKSNFDVLFFFLFWQNLKLMFLQSCSYNIQQILLPLRVNGDVRHAAKKVERWAEASSMPIPAVIPFALLHKSHNSLSQSYRLLVSKKRYINK